MSKIKQADGSVIIPDGWMPVSQLNPIQLALTSTFPAVSPWRKVHAWVRGITSFPLTLSPLDTEAHRYCSKVGWPASLKISFGNYDAWYFSECYKKCCLNSPPCSSKTCGVDATGCNKQGCKQETEKGNMVAIMRPGRKSTRNKHIFKSSRVHGKFFILTWIHLSHLISYLQLSSWQQVFRVDMESQNWKQFAQEKLQKGCNSGPSQNTARGTAMLVPGRGKRAQQGCRNTAIITLSWHKLQWCYLLHRLCTYTLDFPH